MVPFEHIQTFHGMLTKRKFSIAINKQGKISKLQINLSGQV